MADSTGSQSTRDIVLSGKRRRLGEVVILPAGYCDADHIPRCVPAVAYLAFLQEGSISWREKRWWVYGR
jgi:hypothetical protein